MLDWMHRLLRHDSRHICRHHLGQVPSGSEPTTNLEFWAQRLAATEYLETTLWQAPAHLNVERKERIEVLVHKKSEQTRQ